MGRTKKSIERRLATSIPIVRAALTGKSDDPTSVVVTWAVMWTIKLESGDLLYVLDVLPQSVFEPINVYVRVPLKATAYAVTSSGSTLAWKTWFPIPFDDEVLSHTALGIKVQNILYSKGFKS